MYSKPSRMTEYIYDIIRILSKFDFKLWDYASDRGLRVTSAAKRLYCETLGKTFPSDDEAKEIARLIRYKFEDRFITCLGGCLPIIKEGKQRMELEVEEIPLVCKLDVQPKRIDISIECDGRERSETVSIDDDSNEVFIIESAIGNIAGVRAKELICFHICRLTLE